MPVTKPAKFKKSPSNPEKPVVVPKKIEKEEAANVVEETPVDKKPEENLEAAAPDVETVREQEDVPEVLQPENNTQDLSKYTVPAANPSQESESIKQALDDDDIIPKIERSNSRLFIVGIILLAFFFIASGVLAYLWVSSANKVVKDVEVKEVAAIPTPTPVFERLQVGVEVLNGSGVAGAAKKVADQFTALGYTVVKVGNADVVPSTQVFVSSNFKDTAPFIKDVEKELGASITPQPLTDSTASARIVIGKK